MTIYESTFKSGELLWGLPPGMSIDDSISILNKITAEIKKGDPLNETTQDGRILVKEALIVRGINLSQTPVLSATLLFLNNKLSRIYLYLNEESLEKYSKILGNPSLSTEKTNIWFFKDDKIVADMKKDDDKFWLLDIKFYQIPIDEGELTEEWCMNQYHQLMSL